MAPEPPPGWPAMRRPGAPGRDAAPPAGRPGRRPLDGAAVLAAVARVERAAGIAPPPADRTYRRIGAWLVEAGHLRRALLRGWWSPATTVLPYFGEASRRRGLTRLAGDFHRGVRWRAPCAADAVAVRHGVRAFYLGASPPLTIKTALAAAARAGMAAEVGARRRLEALGTIGVPRVLCAQLEGDPPYFGEEVVFGRRLRPGPDAAVIAHGLCPALWRTYQAQGFTIRPARACVDSGGAEALLGARLPAAHAWPAAALPPAAFARAALGALAGAGPLLCAPGHGDLGLTNVLLARNGALWVLDWERACVLPVAVDLVRLLVAVPPAREVVRALAAAAPATTAAPFDEQLLVAILDALLQWTRRAARRPPARPATAMRGYLELASRLLEARRPGAHPVR